MRNSLSVNKGVKVSVVVPIYNGEKDLLDFLECLFHQTYPQEFVEYLLVDNNSCDRTYEILESASKQAQIKSINLCHLTENTIQSSYAARNVGIRKSCHEIIAFTDIDCRPQTDWLEQLVQPFIDENIGIVVGEIMAQPGTSLIEKYSDRIQILSQKHSLKHPFYPYGQTANLAIRRQTFLDIGLFRPYLTTGGDADICWRIQQETAWQLHYNPQAIVRHRHRSNLKDFYHQMKRYGRSNRYLHELYGVDLMRELTTQEILYRLSRWLLKELPRDLIKARKLQAEIIDLIKTPLDLIGFQARTQGQKKINNDRYHYRKTEAICLTDRTLEENNL